MASVLSAKYFHDEEAAIAELERIVWPNGPTCPKCGAVDRINRLAPQRTKPSKKFPEGKPVIGLWKCYHCRSKFRVTVGTVFEDSHIPVHMWWQATHLMCSSKKGISSNQLARILDVEVNTAWFMSMRLREAMRDGKLPPLGGQNKVVEADETYVGGKEKNKHAHKRARAGRGPVAKEAVVSLIERDGRVRSMHLPEVNAKTLRPILKAQIDKRTYLMTDDATVYRRIGEDFAGHGTVRHSMDEYVRGGGFQHTNTIENFFSILKRGITGTFHHVSQQHLHRYLSEFDFRHNERAKLGVDDTQRTARALGGIVGKRLTYRQSPNEEHREHGF
jgi:transposase-like protein